jgi:hypothetical protein
MAAAVGARGEPADKPRQGSGRVEPFPSELPKLAKRLAAVPDAGVTFTTSDAALQRLFAAAEAVCRKNVLRYPPPVDMDILIEGGGYVGAWLETQPMGGHMWGKRDLFVARNNQLIFILNQGADGQLPYRRNSSHGGFDIGIGV